MGGIILWMFLGVVTGLFIGPIHALMDVRVVLALVAAGFVAIFVFVQPNEDGLGDK